MKKNICRRLDELESTRDAALQAKAHREAPSGAEVMRELLTKCRTEQLTPLPGESRADTFARSLGISGLELKGLLDRRSGAS